MADDRLYIKVHNGMPDHPKIEVLSDGAFRLLVALWCWCDRHDTDGKVSLPVWERRGTRRSRQELLDGRLAHRHPDHVALHDYLEHQRSAEQKQAAKERARSAGSAGGKAKAKRAASESLSEPASSASSKNVAEVEGEEEKEQNPPQPSAVTPLRPRPTIDSFQPDPDLLADARTKYPGVDFRDETEAWRDFHRERATKIRDFRASWRRWMRQQAKWNANRNRPATTQVGYTDADRDQPARTMTGNEWRDHG